MIVLHIVIDFVDALGIFFIHVIDFGNDFAGGKVWDVISTKTDASLFKDDDMKLLENVGVVIELQSPVAFIDTVIVGPLVVSFAVLVNLERKPYGSHF